MKNWLLKIWYCRIKRLHKFGKPYTHGLDGRRVKLCRLCGTVKDVRARAGKG